MILIVGLGNPGEKYKNTRHNLGFMVADELIKKSKKRIPSESKNQNNNLKFKIDKRFNAEICLINSQILVAKPMTFMNASGYSVARLANSYQLKANSIWIIHDDVDLPLGKIKIRLGGAAAGHHGVESIIQQLGTDQFIRFRLGIGHPDAKSVEKFVLSEFSQKEFQEAKKMIKKTVKAIEIALEKGSEKAQNAVN